MATFDDLPTLPESGNLSLDDLIGVVDLSDRRSPKKVSLSQLSDLINVTADPTPHATDNDKLLSSPTIGEVVVITGEASRIERFVGNLADPTRFFASGAPVFDFDEEGDNEYLNLDLNGYCYPYMAALAQILQWNAAGDALTYFAGESGAWQWVLNSEPDPVLYTSTDVCEHVSQVTNWTPNPTYPELPAAPTLTAWDNSGFILNNDTPYAPVDILNGRIAYADSGGGTLTYDPNLGWKDVNDVVIGADDVVYPWLIEEPSDPLTGPRPAANNDNWVVLRNTVALTAEVAVDGDGGGTVNGVRIEEGSSAFVGWVDPLSVPLDLDGNAANIQQYSDTPLGTENSVNLSGYVNGSGPQLYTLPLAVRPRESVYIYFTYNP